MQNENNDHVIHDKSRKAGLKRQEITCDVLARPILIIKVTAGTLSIGAAKATSVRKGRLAVSR